jgi:hypothetical protein
MVSKKLENLRELLGEKAFNEAPVTVESLSSIAVKDDASTSNGLEANPHAHKSTAMPDSLNPTGTSFDQIHDNHTAAWSASRAMSSVPSTSHPLSSIPVSVSQDIDNSSGGSYAAKPEPSGMPEPPIDLASSSPGGRVVGQEADIAIQFCPILAVSKYPYRCMPKNSVSEAVSKHYFAAGKFFERIWTM